MVTRKTASPNTQTTVTKKKPATKKTVVKSVPVTKAVTAPKRLALDALPSAAEAVTGWSARITRYYVEGSADLRKILIDANFSRQTPRNERFTVGGYELREVGAYDPPPVSRDERSSTLRIVEVKPL
jgi:hypothetical protein